MLDTEMSGVQLRRWLREQRIRRTDRVVIATLRGRAAALDVLDDRVRAEWATHLQAAGVGYLIVDCLRPILDALGLDEHRDAGRWLVGLDALLVEAGITECLLVHHMGHVAERSRGDSRLRDWPEAEWRLVRHDDNPASARYLAAYGRDVDQPEQQLAWDASARRLTVVGGTRRDAAIQKALDAVLEVLQENPAPLTRTAILNAVAESAGALHSRQRIREAIASGVSAGTIRVTSGPRRAIFHEISQTSAESAKRRQSAVSTPADWTGECASPPPPYKGGALGALANTEDNQDDIARY